MSCCILTDDDVSKIFCGSAILTESTPDDPWFWFGHNKYLNGLKLEKNYIHVYVIFASQAFCSRSPLSSPYCASTGHGQSSPRIS